MGGREKNYTQKYDTIYVDKLWLYEIALIIWSNTICELRS